MSIATVSLALLVAAVLFVLLVEILANRPAVVAGLILGLQTVGIAIDPEYVPFLDLGGTSVYLADVLFGVVALAALARLIGTKRLVGAQTAIIVAGLLAAVSVFRGITEVGLDQAVNEARASFYFFSGVAYFMTVGNHVSVIDRIGRLFLVAAGAISMLIIILWIAMLTGSPVPKPLASPPEPGFRVIGAGQTMILTQALVLALPGIAMSRTFHPFGRLRYLAFILLPIAILLQHRTVWLGMAAGLLILAIRQRSTGRRTIVALASVGAVFVLAMGLLMGTDSNLLTDSLRKSSTDTHTLEWRFEGWVQLLEGRAAPSGADIFVGTPYGSGYDRVIEGRQVEVNPHNYYVETYLRQGLIGLGALVIAYGLSIAHLVRKHEGARLSGLSNPDVLLALAVTHVLFFFTYRPSPDLCAVAGIIVGAVAAGKVASVRRLRSTMPRRHRSSELVKARVRPEVVS